jgi:hypothetical protein
MFLAMQAWRPARAEIVDRILAVVDHKVITWSAALQEANFQAFQSGRPPMTTLSGDDLRNSVSQLIDRQLLQSEREKSPFPLPESKDGVTLLDEVRGRFPSAAAYRTALAQYNLTEPEVLNRLEEQRSLLSFIDFHLRPQVRLTPEVIEEYYTGTLLPSLRKAGQAEAPPLSEVSAKIEQVLVEREINRLLDEWLRDLRSRASVAIMVEEKHPQTATGD